MTYFLNPQNIFYTSKANEKSFTEYKFLLKRIDKYLKSVGKFNSDKEYSVFIKNIISLIKSHKTNTFNSPLFSKEIKPIKTRYPLSEQTPWGGVSLKKVDTDKNLIKKLLVINKYGILGFEIHRIKYERLKILEGLCIVIYSNHKNNNWEKGKLQIKLAFPNDKFEFMPKDEHGIIALTNCVIEETSTNNLGDLVYIFKAS